MSARRGGKALVSGGNTDSGGPERARSSVVDRHDFTVPSNVDIWTDAAAAIAAAEPAMAEDRVGVRRAGMGLPAGN